MKPPVLLRCQDLLCLHCRCFGVPWSFPPCHAICLDPDHCAGAWPRYEPFTIPFLIGCEMGGLYHPTPKILGMITIHRKSLEIPDHQLIWAWPVLRRSQSRTCPTELLTARANPIPYAETPVFQSNAVAARAPLSPLSTKTSFQGDSGEASARTRGIWQAKAAASQPATLACHELWHLRSHLYGWCARHESLYRGCGSFIIEGRVRKRNHGDGHLQTCLTAAGSTGNTAATHGAVAEVLWDRFPAGRAGEIPGLPHHGAAASGLRAADAQGGWDAAVSSAGSTWSVSQCRLDHRGSQRPCWWKKCICWLEEYEWRGLRANRGARRGRGGPSQCRVLAWIPRNLRRFSARLGDDLGLGWPWARASLCHRLRQGHFGRQPGRDRQAEVWWPRVSEAGKAPRLLGRGLLEWLGCWTACRQHGGAQDRSDLGGSVEGLVPCKHATELYRRPLQDQGAEESVAWTRVEVQTVTHHDLSWSTNQKPCASVFFPWIWQFKFKV